jgi:multidrug efflux system outer membrane protein
VKRAIAMISLLATSCMSMEPSYVRPDPGVPPSWAVGDVYLQAAEAPLPAVRYTDVFRDPRLQTLIGQALVNNRDLMVAAANIAEAREQYRIQRAQQFPQVDASAGANVSGARDNGSSNSTGGATGTGTGTETGTGTGSGSSGTRSKVGANFSAGISIPSFELDLFGRLRSLTHAQLEQYFATEEAARATRLTLVAEIADAWLTHASDESLLKIAQETAASAQKSVQITRLRLNGGIAPRTDLRQAEQTLNEAQADLARQRTLVAQDVNALQLLVGTPIAPGLLAGSIDEAFGTVVPLPAGVSSYVLLRRPDVLQAEYQLRAANAQIGAARAALFPRISLTGLLGFASSALTSLLSGGAFGWSVGANADYTIFQAGAGHANVRLTEAQRFAAIATYEHTIQTAFRDVANALARRGTLNDELSARQRDRAATADTLMLTQARYQAGVDPFLNVLEAQRSYYAAQQTLVQMKLTAAQNLVDLYQSLGGDSLLDPPPAKP